MTGQAAATTKSTAATTANSAAAVASTKAVAANTVAVATTAVAETVATGATIRLDAALISLYATLAPMLLTFVGAAAAVLALQGATYLLGKAVEYITGANTAAAKEQKAMTESLEGANTEYERAYKNVAELKRNIDLAKTGLSKRTK